jgi:hypothetical protein
MSSPTCGCVWDALDRFRAKRCAAPARHHESLSLVYSVRLPIHREA